MASGQTVGGGAIRTIFLSPDEERNKSSIQNFSKNVESGLLHVLHGRPRGSPMRSEINSEKLNLSRRLLFPHPFQSQSVVVTDVLLCF